jgi:hypothetical protein
MPVSRISRVELEQAITPRAMLQARVLQIAMTLGPLAFFFAASFLSTQPSRGGGISDDGLDVLSMLNAGLLFAALGASTFLVSRLREAGLENAADGARALAVLRRAALVRMALLETSAMFGIFVLLRAGLAGRLETRPGLWWNVAPLVALVVTALATFPSRGRFVAQFEE